MFHLNQEFDYEAILKSYSMQDIALEKSYKQKLVDYQTYEEGLQKYKEAKKEYSSRAEKHQDLRTNFAEKLNIKNSFLKLQEVPNSKIDSVQDVIRTVYDEMCKDSDDFVNLINDSVTKFQNLGTEFDENVMQKKKSDCIKKIGIFRHEIADAQTKYDTLQQELNREYETAQDVAVLKTTFAYFNKDQVAAKLAGGILEKGAQLTLVQKNIEFLKQRNHELQVQCDIFN